MPTGIIIMTNIVINIIANITADIPITAIIFIADGSSDCRRGLSLVNKNNKLLRNLSHTQTMFFVFEYKVSNVSVHPKFTSEFVLNHPTFSSFKCR